MITILLQKILEQVKALKTNIENMPKGIIYSETETEIGTYLGEKLYSRVIPITTTNVTNSWTTVTGNLTGVNKLVSCVCLNSASSYEYVQSVAARIQPNYKIQLISYGATQAVNKLIITYTKVST